MRKLLVALCLITAAPLLHGGEALTVPDVTLIDQNGNRVVLASLMQNRIVAVNFIFTSCTTVCSPMGATFGAVQKLVAGRDDVALVSITLDPENDTPKKLKAWSSRFGAGPRWTLLTGEPAEVQRALAAFKVDANLNHSPLLVVVNPATGRWTRGNGLARPKEIVALIDDLRAPPKKNAAAHYFTDVELVDQDARPHRFYSDLIAGKIVIINSFFATCHGSCPIMAGKLAALQERFGGRLTILSISVNPQRDTPAALKKFAGQVKAAPGWYFLTGKEENVAMALKKIGQFVQDPSDHQNVFIIGNEGTGLWKKALALSNTDEIAKIVASVIEDRG